MQTFTSLTDPAPSRTGKRSDSTSSQKGRRRRPAAGSTSTRESPHPGPVPALFCQLFPLRPDGRTGREPECTPGRRRRLQPAWFGRCDRMFRDHRRIRRGFPENCCHPARPGRRNLGRTPAKGAAARTANRPRPSDPTTLGDHAAATTHSTDCARRRADRPGPRRR